MKRLLFHIITLALFHAASAQTKHALLFAIGNYPGEGGWPAISSNRDAFYMRSTLLKQGFREENIKLITDENATPQGISAALTELISGVHAGDIAVIHFSSHGQQIEDNNADETDGLDECIVTYHAVAPRLSKDFNRDKEAYFRDDEFGQYINQLRSRIGRKGDVVVFMDLCHSGTGTRGQSVVRGGQPPLVSAGFDPKRYSGHKDASLFVENMAPGAEERSWATYEVFSAARADELNYEVKDDNNEGIGPLTYAISKVFENLDAGTTYRSLFAKIQSVMNRMAPGQHPVLEGNGIDRALLGGQFIQQKPYVEIENIKGTELTLKSGKLYGLDSGAKVAVYPSGTSDPAHAAALATGMVTKAESYGARVQLDTDPRLQEAASGWVFITEPVYRLKPIRIRAGSGFSETDRNKMQEALNDLPLVRWEGEPELILVKGATGDSIKIAANGYTFKTLKDAVAGEELKDALQRYVQYKFLQGLEVKDPSIRVEVLLVPVVNGKPDTTKIDTKVVNGMYEFTEGDQFVLWVKNRGLSPVFINVVDMQPDGVINPVFPFKKKYIYPDDLKINRRSSRLFDMAKYIITVAPPYGTEIFKIFVSKKDIDMEGIAGRGDDDRSAVTISEDLVKKFFEVGTHKTEEINVSNANGSTYSLLFEIKPKR